MHVDRSRHGLRPALPVVTAALWSPPAAAACRSRCRRQRVAAQARRDLVGDLQRCLLGHVHLRWKQSDQADGLDQALAPERDVSITGSVQGRAIKFGAVGAGAAHTGSVAGR